MNIFVSSYDPVECSVNLDDRRLVKMVLETAQIMSTAIRSAPIAFPPEVEELYRPTHINHPCVVWARNTSANFLWLYLHGMALARDYSYRFGRQHKSKEILEKAWSWRGCIPLGEMTPFADCSGLPPDSEPSDIHLRYKECLRRKWEHDAENDRIPRWTGLTHPIWFTPTWNILSTIDKKGEEIASCSPL